MTEPSEVTGSIRLGPAHLSAREARDYVGQALRAAGWSEERIGDARTVVAELVIEALSRGRRPTRMDVLLAPNQVRVELTAQGRLPPTSTADRQAAWDLIVGLSSEHGTRPVEDGRVWWAVLDAGDTPP